MNTVKKCRGCLKVKKLEEFSKNKRNKTDGRQPRCKACNSAYYTGNKEKIQGRIYKRYADNHDSILERRRELAKRPQAKLKKAAQDKAWYVKNREHRSEYYKNWAKFNREYLRAYWKEWYHKNIDHSRMYSRVSQQKRRATISGNGNNTLTQKQVMDLFEKHPYCEYCKRSNRKLTIDHIFPIARGGQNCIENVTIACEHCNFSKGDRLLAEWLQSSKESGLE